MLQDISAQKRSDFQEGPALELSFGFALQAAFEDESCFFSLEGRLRVQSK